MASFRYRAVTSAGQVQEGVREGGSERAVARDLQSMGLVPLHVGAASGTAMSGAHAARGQTDLSSRLSAWFALGGRRITSRDRLLFTQELATLLNAGVPVDRALTICSELTESNALRGIVSDILRRVRSGKSLADALEAQGVFNKLYINMVRAGQASGTLHLVMQRLAEFEASAAEWRGNLISSLIYPALLTLVAIASIGVLMNFVIPRFAQVFESTGLPMPLPTFILLRAGQLFQRYAWMVIVAIIVAVILFRRFIRTPQGRERWDRFQLRVPLIGELLRKAETARFARTMSTLVANSVPLVQSLGIVKEMSGNCVIASSLDIVAQGVKRGEGIAAPVRKSGAFPALAAHLLAVGEETGRLDSMFERLATVYENETKVTMRRLTALFEPMVILGMGLTVGAIVLSLLMAITSINDVPF
ncbi:MAG: type II secretion system F family protein [Acidobacteria bacterium]|nr:type II secretion system F family protein [Acidobacteriota bacterium]